MHILVTFMYADTEVSSRTSSVHEPGGAPRVAILAPLCALGTKAVHRCNTAEGSNSLVKCATPLCDCFLASDRLLYIYLERPSRYSSRLWVAPPIFVTFVCADTEVSSRTSSVHQPCGAPRIAISAPLCALGTKAVDRCNTMEVRSAGKMHTSLLVHLIDSWDRVGSPGSPKPPCRVVDTMHEMQSAFFAILGHDATRNLLLRFR